MSSTSTNPTVSSTMNTIFNVRFNCKDITITVTNKASMATTWVNELVSFHNGKPLIVGLDCEWRPTDIWGFGNKVATLQLCVDNKCLILQLYYMDFFPESLLSFLGDSKNTFVGVEVDDDVKKLRNDYGLKCKKTADIRELALSGFTSYWGAGYTRKPGLKALASRVVGIQMEKPILVCKSDWQARELSKEQIRYAAIDAYASHRIGYKSDMLPLMLMLLIELGTNYLLRRKLIEAAATFVDPSAGLAIQGGINIVTTMHASLVFGFLLYLDLACFFYV